MLSRIFLANIYRRLYILKFWSNQPWDKTAHVSYSITNTTLQLGHNWIDQLGEQNIKRLQDISNCMIKPVSVTLCTKRFFKKDKRKTTQYTLMSWSVSTGIHPHIYRRSFPHCKQQQLSILGNFSWWCNMALNCNINHNEKQNVWQTAQVLNNIRTTWR